MTRYELINHCLSLPSVYEDYPFHDITDADRWTAMRHKVNRKCFAFIYKRNDKLCINLKCDPAKRVTKEQLNQLLEAAMLAPSACNSRPWEFIIVTKRETLDEIAKIHPYAQMCKTATAAIIVVAIPQDGVPEGYFSQDCGAATQNILLEAVTLGLGTCWCGVYPRDERVSEFAKLFNIQASKIPFNVITVRYPAEAPERRGYFDESKVTYIE